MGGKGGGEAPPDYTSQYNQRYDQQMSEMQKMMQDLQSRNQQIGEQLGQLSAKDMQNLPSFEPIQLPEGEQITTEKVKSWKDAQKQISEELKAQEKAQQNEDKNKKGRKKTVHTSPLLEDEDWSSLQANLTGVTKPLSQLNGTLMTG